MSGYDAPAPRSEDLLNRWQFAREVHHILESTPPAWSVRIGIHGKWGDGKTTILRYVADLTREQEGLVIWFTPWSATTRDELWRDFLVATARAFQDAGVSLGQSLPARAVSGLLKYKKITNDLGNVHPWAQFVNRGFFHLLDELFRPDGKVFPALRAQLGDRRVLILIDDLDRAEPDILPFLFLSLRDVFDLPGFGFILAFDDEIVADALDNVRSFERHGLSFIDKLFDFTLAIPEMTTEQVEHMLISLARNEIGCFDHRSIAAVASLIQKNPRKIKRFARYFRRVKSTLDRLDDDEVDFRALYLSLLLEIESAPLLARFLDEIESANMDLLRSQRNDSDRGKHRSELEKLIGIYGLNSRIEYLVHIMDEFINSSLFTSSAALNTARLWSRRPSVTLKECRKIIMGWKQRRELADVDKWVLSQAQEIDTEKKKVAIELMPKLAALRNSQLANAAHISSTEQNRMHVEEALIILTLEAELYCDGLPSFGQELYHESAFLQTLISPMVEWAHFRVNEADRRARAAEREALLRCVGVGLRDPEDFLTWLKPWAVGGRAYGVAERQELLSLCARRVEEAVAVELLTNFSRPAGMANIISDQGTCHRYILSLTDGLSGLV